MADKARKNGISLSLLKKLHGVRASVGKIKNGPTLQSDPAYLDPFDINIKDKSLCGPGGREKKSILLGGIPQIARTPIFYAS